MRSMRPALALLGCLFLLLPAAPRAEELDEGDKRFLSDVLPLILPDERALFEKLEDKADRIVFQEIFWARRDPNLATPENEFQRQYVKDRATADQKYGVSWAWGSATDCGRLFILAGKPDSVVILDRLETIGEIAPSGRRPELWVYRDRPERRTGFGRFEALFDKECRSRGDLGRGGDITAQLDRIAATKIVHPGIDYVVGRDGHLVKPGDQSARIPGKTIVVDVVVTDDDGQPITDLAQTDIELYEDGVRQPITSFERFEASAPPLGMAAPPPENAEARTRVSSNTGEQDPRGRTFVIVFDDAHLTVDTARQARAAAALFLSAETREGDRVTLVAPAAGVWWNARMPEDRETLLERLDTLRGSLEPALQPDPVTDYESMRGNVYRDRTLLEQVQDPDARRGVGQGDPMDRARDPGRTRRDMASPTTPSPALAARSQLTLEAAERALRSLVGHRGRKSLILASDGFIHDDRLEAWKRTVTASLRAHTAIYFLNTRGLQAASESDEEKKIEALESVVFGQELETAGGAVALAQDTGGFICAQHRRAAARLEANRRRNPRLLPDWLQPDEYRPRRGVPQDRHQGPRPRGHQGQGPNGLLCAAERGDRQRGAAVR